MLNLVKINLPYPITEILITLRGKTAENAFIIDIQRASVTDKLNKLENLCCIATCLFLSE